MNSFTYRDPLINAYYLASLPARWRDAGVREASGNAPLIGLFYHRIADAQPNPWTMSFRRFRQQMEWIRRRYAFCTLAEAQARIASGENRTPAVFVTFDDGYAENCEQALPWLLQEGIPFTYFVASRHVLDQQPFAHDVQAGRPLAPNTSEQIRALAEAGVEIGAHTRTHCDLGQVGDEATLADEIVGSQQDLQQMTGRPVRYFAFPFGLPANMSTAAFRVALNAGFAGVCSAYGGYNLPGDDAFHLQRVHGDPSWARFRNWLTGDPLKLKRPRAFDPGDYRSSS